jgi:hypothetical protein
MLDDFTQLMLDAVIDAGVFTLAFIMLTLLMLPV